MRQSAVLVMDSDRGLRVTLDYAALNLDGADTVIRDRTAAGVGLQEVAIGDRLAFQDREGRQRHGIVVHLNDKTVTLDCDGQPWRVSYALLHRLIDARS